MTRLRPEDLPETIMEIAVKLREMGYRISTAEIVKAARIALSYYNITGRLDKDDLSYILRASFTIADPRREDVEHAIRSALSGSGIRERASRISEQLRREVETLGFRPGQEVSKKKISRLPKRKRKAAMASYLRLKRLGAIRGRPGREKLADIGDLERLAWTLARMGYENIDDAVRDAGPRLSWDDILMHAETRVPLSKNTIHNASENKLIRIAEAARKKGDRRLHKAVAEELAARALRGEVKRKEEVGRILMEEGLLTHAVKRRLAEGLDEDYLSIEDVASIARDLGREKGGELVARKMKTLSPEEAVRLANIVDPHLLWASKPPRGNGPEYSAVEAAVNAARALREAVLYAETGEEGRADMADYYIEKARGAASRAGGASRRLLDSVEDMIREARAILRLADSIKTGRGDAREAINEALVRLDFLTSVRVLRSAYSIAPSEWKPLLEEAMERILYRFSSREGLRLLPERERANRPPGTFDVRHSIYGILRWKSWPFQYRRRLMANPLSLALDVSGSMLEYAAWSIGVASLFPRHLRRLVVFRHHAMVYDGPLPRRLFARILLETRFRGYTNISEGLMAASVPGVRRIIAITDLQQTVDTIPVEQAVSELRSSGKKILFIVPPGHDHEARRRVEKARARVVVASNPREAARYLLRALLR